MDIPNNPPKTEQEIRIFQLNDELAEFEELELENDIKLFELLKSEIILYLVNPSKYRSYIWTGSKTSTRMKFIAAGAASSVRDQIGPAIKINTEDENEESFAFKVFVGLEEEKEIIDEGPTGPAYSGSAEEENLLENLSLEKIILLLEKIGCPEGYSREMVIDGKNIYGYHESYNEYLGEIIKERKLYRIEEKVPDGPYFIKDLVPRILMSYNSVVIVELLKQISPKEQEEINNIEEKVKASKTPEAPFTNQN